MRGVHAAPLSGCDQRFVVREHTAVEDIGCAFFCRRLSKRADEHSYAHS